MPDFPYPRDRAWVNKSEGWTSSDPVANAAWFDALEDAIHQGQDHEKLALQAADLVTDYVASGFLPTVPAPASLTMTTPPGVGYVGGLRVRKAAEDHAYDASQDTYVDLAANGSLVYTGVANGAAEPALAAGALRLFVATTGATGVTAVADRRDLDPDLRGTPNLTGYARILGDPANGQHFAWDEANGMLVPVDPPAGGGAPAFVGFAVHAIDPQDISANGFASLIFDTTDYDTSNLYSPATSVLTPGADGIWHLEGAVMLMGTHLGSTYQLQLSDGFVVATLDSKVCRVEGENLFLVGSVQYWAGSGSNLQLVVNNGGSTLVTATGGYGTRRFRGHLIGMP